MTYKEYKKEKSLRRYFRDGATKPTRVALKQVEWIRLLSLRTEPFSERLRWQDSARCQMSSLYFLIVKERNNTSKESSSS